MAAPVVLTGSLAACGDDADSSSPAARLSELAARSVGEDFVGDFDLESGPPSDREVAKVKVFRLGDSFRLDVRTDEGTARYISTPEGTVSCDLPPGTTTAEKKAAESGRSDGAKSDGAKSDGAKSDGAKSDGAKSDEITCLQVAGPGETPPEAFDPGLQRLFGETLQAFIDGAPGLEVTDAVDDEVPVKTDITCFLVSGTAVDAGTYCLTELAGIPGKVTFASGTLAMTALNFMPPKPDRFVAPVPPSPLPSGAATP